jgi:glycosyltransferase involved in cell wall biosynthesis
MEVVKTSNDKLKEGPLVTIVMIFLNEEKFMAEAIGSVLAQSYQRWELLLIDDGSIDGSTGVARAWAERHRGRIFFLEHEGHQNLGMSASRNLGIERARGEYIAFLDADDVWLPGKLQRQIATLESQPEAAMLCAPAQFWYSWTGDAADVWSDFVQKFAVPCDQVIEPPILVRLFLEDEWMSLCDVLVRRKAVDAVGGYEESFRGMYEDQVFHAKLCLNFPVFVSSEWGYRYRQHPEACTAVSNKAGRYYENRRPFLSWLEEYLFTSGNRESEIWRALRKEQWHLRHLFLSSLLRRLRRMSVQLKGSLKQTVVGTRRVA